MKKLSVLRNNLTLKCPFNLDIPEACHKVGDMIYNMSPGKNNLELFNSRNKDSECPYAVEYTKNFVNCSYNNVNVKPMSLDPESMVYPRPFPSAVIPNPYISPNQFTYDNFKPEPLGMLNLMASTTNKNLNNQEICMEKQAEEIVEVFEEFPFDEVVVEEPLSDHVVLTEEEMPDSKELSFDWDSNKDFKHFIQYVLEKIKKIPSHSGKTTSGCERAISYLRLLDKEISRAFSEDFDCKISDTEAEELRKKIRSMVKTLQKKLEQINNAYDGIYSRGFNSNEELTKLAEELRCGKCNKFFQTPDAKEKHMIAEHGEMMAEASNCSCNVKTASSTGLWNVAVTPFESCIAKAIINSRISQGRDPAKVFEHFKNKYALTDREQLGICQLLEDMGFPILRDRAIFGEDADQPVELMTSYFQ